MLNYPFYFFACFHFFCIVILNPYLLHTSSSSIPETIYMDYLFHLFQPSFSFFNINLPETPSLSLLQFKTKLKQKEDFPGDCVVNSLRTNTVDSDSNSGPGRSPGEGSGNSSLQYSCLGNHMGREAWWATVHGIAKSRTRHSNLTTKTKRNNINNTH